MGTPGSVRVDSVRFDSHSTAITVAPSLVPHTLTLVANRLIADVGMNSV